MYTICLSLRAILYYIWLAISTILFTFVLYLALPLPYKKGRMQVSGTWARLVAIMGKLICGMDYKVIGLENCPKTPAIYVAKHQSAWETMVLPGLLPPSCFVAKDSLLKIPVFGWAMRACKTIPIDRKARMSALKKVLRIGKERINKDKLSIIIFPEGTRVAPKEHPKFYKTAMMLAQESGAPVVPIAHNSGSCWRRNSFLKYPGQIKVIIGKPIDTTKLSCDEMNAEVYEWIKTQMTELEK